MRSYTFFSLNSGQAIITLLIFMLIALTVTSASVVVIIVNSFSTNAVQDGNEAFTLAENGIENAVLRLLRDPNYSGETLTIDNGTATVTVSGTTTKTITSVGVSHGKQRTIQAQALYQNNNLTVNSWEEIF